MRYIFFSKVFVSLTESPRYSISSAISNMSRQGFIYSLTEWRNAQSTIQSVRRKISGNSPRFSSLEFDLQPSGTVGFRYSMPNKQ